MIRLNEIQENKIINNGAAGLVENVKLTVERKSVRSPERFPDFKLVFTENNGAEIDIGFYYFEPKPNETEEQQDKRSTLLLKRLMHVARAVMGHEYAPTQEFETVNEAMDFIFNVIEENSGDQRFDIFINFGSKNFPNKRGYLEVRFAVPFIRTIGDNTVILSPYADDIMNK